MTTSKLVPENARSAVRNRLNDARLRGASWLVDRIGQDGAPLGHDQGNSWWRLSWSLVWAGEIDLRDRDPAGGEEWMKTCQAGITALTTGRDDVAHGVYRFLRSAYDAQPELPRRLYTMMVDGAVVTTFQLAGAFTHVVDFSLSRQAYYQPGIAAAFLAGYGSRFNAPDAIQLGRDLLELNVKGTSQQFDDPESVQISKFGWGEAAMLQADPDGGHLPHVMQMANWFIDRQNEDGSWSPSSFMVAAPSDRDKLWKTSEHLMIVSMIQAALG